LEVRGDAKGGLRPRACKDESEITGFGINEREGKGFMGQFENLASPRGEKKDRDPTI